MSSWKIASAVFAGGTEGFKRLYGKRVRTRQELLDFPLHNPAERDPGTRTLAEGTVGFVAHPYRDGVLLAFPATPGATARSIEELRQRPFHVVIVNQPTFKMQFEVEA